MQRRRRAAYISAMAATTPESGAQFQVVVDGIVRTYRSDRGTAILAAQFLQLWNPGASIVITDLSDGSIDCFGGSAPGGASVAQN